VSSGSLLTKTPTKEVITMPGIGSLRMFCWLLCIIITLFYLFQLVVGHQRLSYSERENTVGHGLMALGMAFMLAPVGGLPVGLLQGGSTLFAVTALWWTCRLLARQALMALLLGKTEEGSTIQADSMQVVMHSGMCYMFLLMSNMTFSMTQPAASVTCLFFVSFALLTFFSGQAIAKNLQIVRSDWLQLGTPLAHASMNGMMSWMFLEMIAMTVSMR
jgi:hypothetical protein